MLYKDIEQSQEKEVAMTEYLASFWNSEAVKKIQEKREEKKKHSFLGNEEFEKQIKNQDYKNNELIKAIQKNNANNKSKSVDDNSGGYKNLKRPTSLRDLLKKMD